MKKIFTAIILISLPFFITACTIQDFSPSDLPVIGRFFGGGNGAIGGPADLSMWGLWENPDVMNTLIENYSQNNSNVTVNYDDRSVLKPSEYKEILLGRLSQESGVPDIVLVHNTWIPEMYGLLEPMPSKIMDAETYAGKFYSSAVESAVINGNIYASPMYFDTLVLVYNKDHFDEIDQQTPPTSWEEFRSLAIRLTQIGENRNLIRAGAAIGTADNIDFSTDIIGLFFEQARVSVPDRIDSVAAQDALSFYTKFSVDDKVWSSSLPKDSIAFAREEVSMIFIPSWNLLDIVKARPDLNIGVGMVPQIDPQNPVTWGSFWMYAVPKNSSSKQASWEFINYLTSEEQELLRFDLATNYRSYGAPFANASLRNEIESSSIAEYLRPVLMSGPYSSSNIFAGRSGNQQQTESLKEAVNAVISTSSNSRKTPEEALRTVKTRISP